MVAVIYLVKLNPIDEIVSNIRLTSSISKDKVLNKMKKSVQDDDIIETKSVLSLICPLGICRIKNPIRSKKCTHNQCFDAEMFIELNRNMQIWKCPVCSLVIPSIYDLVLDEYFDEILQKISKEFSQVEINPDGSYDLKENCETPKALACKDGNNTTYNGTPSNKLKRFGQNGTNDDNHEVIDSSDDELSIQQSSYGPDRPGKASSLYKRQRSLNSNNNSSNIGYLILPNNHSSTRSITNSNNGSRPVIDLTLSSSDPETSDTELASDQIADIDWDEIENSASARVSMSNLSKDDETLIDNINLALRENSEPTTTPNQKIPANYTTQKSPQTPAIMFDDIDEDILESIEQIESLSTQPAQVDPK
ncbi:E3 SUMO-protein ligase pli1 [Smittium culicis]|uniref:E3 SUMO-protein ligase pli1 n=1 Tax=Smittium culicis TaxID=133412 RepID=A0A1R1YET6_9FUNG|nr:E3 SUMO-protein ligase pli1 [Smittium culicis]